VHRAKDEGVHFEMLVNPVEFLGDEKRNLTSVKCIRQELGEPDESGRRSPVPSPDQRRGIRRLLPSGDHRCRHVTEPADPVHDSGTGDYPARLHLRQPDTLATSKQGVFAGRDIVTGGATVILAMGVGRKAARSIHQYLMSLNGAIQEAEKVAVN